MTVLCWLWLLATFSQPSLQDSIVDVAQMMGNVEPQTCSSLPFQLKIMPRHSVIEYESGYTAPIADFQDILYESRKIVLNRAIFFSYALQQNSYQPESIYYHLSVLSNLLADVKIQSSGILFDKNKMNAKWLNSTLPRYGPYAYQVANNSYQFLGKDISTESTYDYLNESSYNPKPWYNSWMNELPPNPKATKINITIIKEDGSLSRLSFYSPSHVLPVKVTQPYYECNQLHDWIVSATSPIVGIIFRDGLNQTPIFQYIAIATADIRYIDIDINPCSGNASKNIFAGSAKCKDTTKCQPLGKFGIHRGSYECYCKLGYRYPDRQDGSFMGEEIENVTSSQYSNPANFNCLKITGPRISDPSEKISESLNGINILKDNQNINDDIVKLLNKVHTVFLSNCSSYAEKIDLGISNELLRTIKKQFKSQIYYALRLAHFLSSFLQNFNTSQTNFLGWNNHTISSELMYGELIAIMLSDKSIKTSSLIFEENVLINKQFFAATIKRSSGDDSFNQSTFDNLIIKHYLSNYSSEVWYQKLKHRKQTPKLYDYTLNIEIHSNNSKETQGKKIIPLTYKAVSFDYASQASGPLYDCFYNATLIWFDVPFFKLDGKNDSKLAGFVSVGLDAHSIDINQCGDAEDELFQGTNMCDIKSTKCVSIRNWGFQLGGYRCECNPGYEYPYNGSQDFFSGHIIENEYLKYLEGKDNILKLLKCRKVNNQWTVPPEEKESFPVRKLKKPVLSHIKDQTQISLFSSANNNIQNVRGNGGDIPSFSFISLVTFILIVLLNGY